MPWARAAATRCVEVGEGAELGVDGCVAAILEPMAQGLPSSSGLG